MTTALCYEAPSCTATEFYDSNTGFTNDTGWSLTDANYCCQICLPGTPATVCFDENDKDCATKTGDGDYDYMLLDQIWRPQFCSGLANGYDPTLTHLEGSTCYEDTKIDSLLTIHGLWPNYWGGYPQCCNASQATYALFPQEVVEWDIYSELSRRWPDPTDATNCSVCLMFNHEWLKHGGCYSPGDPKIYFSDALLYDSLLETYSARINDLNGTVVLTSDLQKLYPTAVNIICDPRDSTVESTANGDGEVGHLLEVQTCWSRDGTLLDCPPTGTYSFTAPCPTYTYLRA